MKLLIDFGNTRCKWALLDEEKLGEMCSESYKNNSPIESIDNLLQKLPLAQAEEIHAVSVLKDEFNSEFSKRINKQLNITVQYYFSQKEKYGVSLSYSNPSEYGADRYAGIVAAHHAYTDSKIIVDCGTAITVDAIDQDGKHLGGIIFPSEEILHASLIEKTDRVFCNNQDSDVKYLNSSTSNAVYAGTTLGVRHGVWSIVGEIRQTLEEPYVILTGGNAAKLHDLKIEPYINNPTLVLDGLKTMVNFDHNKN